MKSSTTTKTGNEGTSPPASQGAGAGGNLYLLQMAWVYIKRCRKRCNKRDKQVDKRRRMINAIKEDNGKKSFKSTAKGRSKRFKMTTYVEETQGRRGYLKGGEQRLFALKVDVTSVGESVTDVVGVATELRDYVSELHVVVPFSLTGTEKERADHPLKGLYKGWKQDEQDLKKAQVTVIVHARRFRERLVGNHVRRLVDNPSICELSRDVFEELLEEYMTPHFHKEQYRRYRYSVRTKLEEPHFTLWTPVVVAILIFNWWRALFTRFFMTLSPTDVRIYPVNHADYGPFIPDERRFLRLVPFTLGVYDRSRPLFTQSGATNFIPEEWTGWERVVWLSQRTDLPGPWGMLVGYVMLVWLIGVPYWNIFIPWLEVELFGYVRIAAWALHGCIMALALNRSYAGPLQNLVIFFGVPIVMIGVLPIMLWAKYGVKHSNSSRKYRSNRRDVPVDTIDVEDK